MAPSSPSPPLDPVATSSDANADPLGRGRRKSAWYFVPCSGAWQGLINPVLLSIPTVVMKSMGVSNAVIGYSTLATLPMGLKFLFGPMIDASHTRRWWVFRSGEALILGVVLVGLSLMPAAFSLPLFLGALTLLAIAKAIQQIAIQGFFTLSLTKSELALFSGLDPVFGRIGTVLTASIMLAVADVFGRRFGDARITWALYFGGLTLLFVALYLYSRVFFPYPAADKPSQRVGSSGPRLPMRAAVRGYFGLPAIGAALVYFFFLRSGETFLVKMSPAFLMDPATKGGLGLTIGEVGLFTGVMTGCSIAGGVISGLLLKRFGLRRVIWPLTLASVIPHLTYVYLSLHHASTFDLVSLNLTAIGLGHRQFDWVVVALLGVENLGYGLGFTAVNYYMFRMASGTPYPATYVGFSNSVIYFSHVLCGSISGAVQEKVGYTWLFVLSILISLPVFAAIPYLNYGLDEKRD